MSDETLAVADAVIMPDQGDSASDFVAQHVHYLILTRSGKPVFSLHGSDDAYLEYMGIIQALVDVFESGGQLLESFKAQNTLFVFRVISPLILVAIDKLHRSVAQLQIHLDILHAQILSTLTQSQLAKAFESKPNINLGPLLGGTEVFLRALTTDITEGYAGVWLNSLESLALPRSVREQLNEILLESRDPNLLYGMIVADKRLVSIVRPKKHSLHPPDLYLVFSMLFNTTSFKEGEHWVPICLPRFNSTGFLYAYIHFVAPQVAIVLISPMRTAFFDMQRAYTVIHERMSTSDILKPIVEAVDRGRLKLSDLNAGDLQHFVYKSRHNVQFVQSEIAELGDEQAQQQGRLAYSQLQAYMHENGLRICFSNHESCVVLGWQTAAFELYCVTKHDSNEQLSESVRHVLTWLRKHEDRLFVLSGATF